MHRKVAAALVAALALGVASCGGSDSEPLSRAQLGRKLQAACAEARRRAEAQLRASRDGESAFVTMLISAQRSIAERIDEVEPSDAVQAQYDALKQAADERLELLESLESLEGRELERAMVRIEGEANASTQRLQRAAEAIGVEGCF